MDAVPGVAPEGGEGAVGRRSRQPVHERHQRVHLEREEPVRRAHEHALRHPAELCQKPPLLRRRPDVFDDCVRERGVEFAVGERKGPPVRHDATNLGKDLGEALERPVADRGDPVPPGVELLEEVVGVAVAALGGETCVGGADVDDRRPLVGADGLQEESQLPAPVRERDPGRETG